MTSFESRVKNTRLTRIERQAAEYILENFEYIGFLKSAEIAKRLGVSTSSVVRLSRTLGYAGFNEMMGQIREEIMERMNGANAREASPASKLAASWNRHDADRSISLYLEKTQSILHSVMEKNSPEKFQQARDIMLRAKTRYIAGYYGCRPLADLTMVHVSRILPQTFCLCHADSDSYVRLVNITADDCLILFSCARYADMAIRTAQIAREAGARVIVVTDKLTAPVAIGADVVLLAEHDCGSFFNSSVGLTMIAEILSLSIATEHSDAVQQRMNKIDEYVTQGNLF